MTLFHCPHCNERIVISNNIGDYVHDCSQSTASDGIKEEDVVIIGSWEDFSGSGTKAPQEVLRQGIENQSQRTHAGILGYKSFATTDRGARASTHRQRKHFEYIDLKDINFKSEKGGL